MTATAERRDRLAKRCMLDDPAGVRFFDEDDEDGDDGGDSGDDIEPVSKGWRGKSVTDAQGHKHGDDGRFTSGGGDDLAAHINTLKRSGPLSVVDHAELVKRLEALTSRERLGLRLLYRVPTPATKGKCAESRAIADHVRMLAAGKPSATSPPKAPGDAPAPSDAHAQAHAGVLEAAFRKLDAAAGGHNLVSLADLRDALPDMPREQQDAAIRHLRTTGRLTTVAHEGRHGVSERDRAAGFEEGGQLQGFVAFRKTVASDIGEPAWLRKAWPVKGKRDAAGHVHGADGRFESGESDEESGQSSAAAGLKADIKLLVDSAGPIKNVIAHVEPREGHVYRFVTLADYHKALETGRLEPGRSADHGGTTNFSKEPIPIYGGAASQRNKDEASRIGLLVEIPEEEFENPRRHWGSKDLYLESSHSLPLSSASRVWGYSFVGPDGVKMAEITDVVVGKPSIDDRKSIVAPVTKEVRDSHGHLHATDGRFTTSGPSAGKREAMQRLSELVEAGGFSRLDGMAAPPFRRTEERPWAYGPPAREEEAEVRLDDLATPQTFVKTDNVEHFLDGGHASDRGLPKVWKTRTGELVIEDGNHELAARKLAGELSVRVRLLTQANTTDDGSPATDGKPAGTPPTAPPAKSGTSGKLSVEDAESLVQSARDNPTADTVVALGRQLATMTVAQLESLKRKLGVRAGGKKSDMAAKIAAEATKRLTQTQEFRRQARSERLDWDDVRHTAYAVRDLHNDEAERLNSVIREARAMFKERMGKTLSRSHPAFDGGDWTGLPGWDTIARTLADRYPEVLGVHGYSNFEGYDPDQDQAAERLYELFAGGIQPRMRRKEAFEESLAYLGDKRKRELAEVPF